MSIVFNRSTSFLVEPGSLASISSMMLVKRLSQSQSVLYSITRSLASEVVAKEEPQGNPLGAFDFLELTTMHQDARNQDAQGL